MKLVIHQGNYRKTSAPSQADNARDFWVELLDKTVQYNEDTEWLVKVKKNLEVVKIQSNVIVTKMDVTKQVRKMRSCKSQGLGYIQGFWLKGSSSLHQTIPDIHNNEL